MQINHSDLAEISASAMVGWAGAKAFVERASGISMDALHVIAGVLLLVAFAFFLRRPITSWVPWFGVLGTVAANEAADLLFERWPTISDQLAEAAKDIGLTMLAPTFLLLVFRRWPGLCGRME